MGECVLLCGGVRVHPEVFIDICIQMTGTSAYTHKHILSHIQIYFKIDQHKHAVILSTNVTAVSITGSPPLLMSVSIKLKTRAGQQLENQ